MRRTYSHSCRRSDGLSARAAHCNHQSGNPSIKPSAVTKLTAELDLPDLGSKRRKPSREINLNSTSATLPPNFETEDTCFERQLALVDRLMKSTSVVVPVVRQLFACMCFPYPCRRPFCSQCGRSFRVWYTVELSKLAKTCRAQSQVVTIILKRVSLKDLRSVDLRAVKARLRMNCVRLGLKDLPVCGGLEVAYDAKDNAFILHAHLLVIGGTTNEWARLRPLFRKTNGPRAVKVQPLRDPPQQLSYLLKWVSYHRPGFQFGSHRARAVPLPLPALEELVAWWAQYEVSDFLFLHRMRVVAGHIKPTVSTAMRPP